MNFALKTNVGIWKCNKLKFIDKQLIKNNLILINLPWTKFNLIKDNLHFKWIGFKKFSMYLLRKIKKLNIKNLFIYSDSTIGFFNKKSNKYLINLFAKEKIILKINAINGSGFVNEIKFKDRIFKYNLRNKINNLFIGGWNDINYTKKIIQHEINNLLN